MTVRSCAVRRITTHTMKTCLVAIDCWDSMPRSQKNLISRFPADLHLNQSHGRPQRHPVMRSWPTYTPQALVGWIRTNRPCRLVYAGQQWQMCLRHRPTGMHHMSRLRPWCEVWVAPDLCRTWISGGVDPDREWPRDRVLRRSDLEPGWREREPGLWRWEGAGDLPIWRLDTDGLPL